MRVLFVHSGSDLYGASRSLLRLSSRLVDDGHNVCVVLPGEGPLGVELNRTGAQVVIHRRLPVVTRDVGIGLAAALQLAGSIPVSMVQLYRLARTFGAEVIHTNTALILSPGPVARLLGVPHVWHVREVFAEFQRLWQWYQRFMVAFADRIVCVSAAVAGQFSSPGAKGKVVVLHNGFPASEFSDVESDRIESFRKRFALGERPVVSVIGRIKLARKGQDVLVRAIARLPERHHPARFLCVGSPFPGNEAHQRKLVDLAEQLGVSDHLTITGDVDDVHAAYASSDVVVLPSALPEPFGGVVVEAMALGIPVIGTAIGGTTEQILDGQTGYLVPPNDPAALADRLTMLLDDQELRRTMGEKGRSRFLSEFEFEPFYRTMLSIYETALSDRVPRRDSWY